MSWIIKFNSINRAMVKVASRLRQLSVFIDVVDYGSFCWSLLNSDSNTWLIAEQTWVGKCGSPQWYTVDIRAVVKITSFHVHFALVSMQRLTGLCTRAKLNQRIVTIEAGLMGTVPYFNCLVQLWSEDRLTQQTCSLVWFTFSVSFASPVHTKPVTTQMVLDSLVVHFLIASIYELSLQMRWFTVGPW